MAFKFLFKIQKKFQNTNTCKIAGIFVLKKTLTKKGVLQPFLLKFKSQYVNTLILDGTVIGTKKMIVK